MKKDELMKLGLDEATAEKVAAASTEELKGFIPKERFDEVNRAKKHAEEALAERDGQIESLKASAGDADALKKQIETLQAENKQKDAAHAEEIKQMIVTWCQQGFSVSDTARALFIHKNTLLYRMERLQRLTGYDLRVFRDALTLYLMIGMQQFRNVSAENVRAFLQPNYSEGPEKHGTAR